MFSFRQKIFISYVVVFFAFLVMMLPCVSQWVHHIIMQTMQDQASAIIRNIKDAPNNEALIRRLKDQKSLTFFRVSVISNEQKLLYDSHTKRILGPKFSQEYIVYHPEVLEAFQTGIGYHVDYSNLLDQKFAYLAKAFDFHGKTYILRTAFPFQYVSEITKDFEIGLLGFAAAILLLFSFMTWFIIHYLTKPIQKIITVVKPYQEGLQTELPNIDIGILNTKDDFGKLALTLNSLSAKIQNHINNLTQERNEKEAILESLVEGVIAVDVNMTISYMNHMAFKLLNKVEVDLIGQPFSKTGQDKCHVLLTQCQKEHIPLTDTLEISRDGKKAYLDIVAAPKRDNKGGILVLQDKTQHYRIFEMRRDFVANASHELKTPITVIHGFAEALHDNLDLPRETIGEITSKIVRNCQRMTALIKDLLTLSDIEGIPCFRLSDCNLDKLVEKCRSMLLEIFPHSLITIDKLMPGETSLIADADLLELAVMNLMENAAKYSNPPAHIHIRIEDFLDNVKIIISDQGIGIPKADQEHIFDRFYTVDKAHSQKMGGSGLGLSIVKTIIEKHFGTIFVKSEPGKGSAFTIVLPKRKFNLSV